MAKKIILLVFVVFLIIAIPVTFFVVRQRQELRQKAAPATTLYLTPAEKTVEVGETFTLDVNLNTGQNSILAAAVHLTFDHTKLQAQSIVNSPQFPNIISSADTSQAGKISITVATTSINQPFQGTGAVATVRFSVRQSSDTPISIRFGPDSFIGSIGEGSTNALIGTTPAEITITSSEITPTSTPSLTPTPSVSEGTITPTPTAQPTSGPSSTPTPTTTPGNVQLSLTSHTNSSTTTQRRPTLSGTAPANSTITITFYPGTVTGAVTANASGNWSFTPSSDVGIGTYTITITSTHAVTGATQTTTSTLTIASSSSTITPTPTRTPTPTLLSSTVSPEQVPTTGSLDLTYTLISIALLFIAAGIILPFAVSF